MGTLANNSPQLLGTLDQDLHLGFPPKNVPQRRHDPDLLLRTSAAWQSSGATAAKVLEGDVGLQRFLQRTALQTAGVNCHLLI